MELQYTEQGQTPFACMNDELQQLEALFERLLYSDNNTRSEAERAYEATLTSHPDKLLLSMAVLLDGRLPIRQAAVRMSVCVCVCLCVYDCVCVCINGCD